MIKNLTSMVLYEGWLCPHLCPLQLVVTTKRNQSTGTRSSRGKWKTCLQSDSGGKPNLGILNSGMPISYWKSIKKLFVSQWIKKSIGTSVMGIGGAFCVHSSCHLHASWIIKHNWAENWHNHAPLKWYNFTIFNTVAKCRMDRVYFQWEWHHIWF